MIVEIQIVIKINTSQICQINDETQKLLAQVMCDILKDEHGMDS